MTCMLKVERSMSKRGRMVSFLNSSSIFQTCGFSVECFASYKYNDKQRSSA